MSQGLSFGRSLANWYALRLIDELRAVLWVLPEAEHRPPWAKELAERIKHTLPEESDLQRWRSKQTQPKASERDA